MGKKIGGCVLGRICRGVWGQVWWVFLGGYICVFVLYGLGRWWFDEGVW